MLSIIFIVFTVLFGLYAVYLYLKSNKLGNKTSKLITLKNSNEKYYLTLIEKEEISHDTRRFRFALPTKQHILGLPIGQHVNLITKTNDELVIRSYTPVSSDDDHGFVDLVIKVYKRNVHPKFPNGGKMSQHLDEMKIGDKIAFRGPSGKLQYNGNGNFVVKQTIKDPALQLNVSKINMIAGGTGITPMLQLMRDILKQPNEKHIKMALLYANQTEKDILLRNELDQLAHEHPDQLKVWYTVDQSTESTWKFSTGFVNADMIREQLHPADRDTVTLMCGPPPMINYACIPNLDAVGHEADRRFAY